MHYKPIVVFHSPDGRTPPESLHTFAAERGFRIETLRSTSDVLALVNRTFPACVVLKGDSFSAIIPVIFMTADDDEDAILGALNAGADAILTGAMSDAEWRSRLEVTLARADRDVSVHPSTSLPGTAQIERDMGERMRSGQTFAVCYADLDHFKEFNDRYGYNRGDGVILLLSRILRDVVKAYSPGGFIGHIGGDDFIFIVPVEHVDVCCEEILAIFDELIPYQYSEQDRQKGSFLAKDRRGNIHDVPLMSLSIGVVTNRKRNFVHTARVSELATEMKSYAKTLPGSVYAVDRRSDQDQDEVDAGAGTTSDLETSATS